MTGAAHMRSPFLVLMTVYLVVVLFAWWVVELIIQSEPQATPTNDYTLQVTLAEQSLQLFMYTCLLTLFTLAGSWFSELERTKAAVSVGMVVTTLTKSAWLYQLWFVISVYDNSTSPLNWYCTGGPYFAGLTSSSSDWCRLAQTVASLSIALFVGYIALWVWAVICFFQRIVPDVPIPTTHLLLPSHRTGATNQSNAAHSLDINWRCFLTHPEDLEQHHIASHFPHIFGPTRARLLFVGRLCHIPMFLVSIGTLLLTYPSIAFSHATGLNAWTTSAGATNNTEGYTGWGDPIIAANWYFIIGALCCTMVVNAYANNRSNRSWAAAAAASSALVAAFFWSFFIYSARRLHASTSNLVSTSLLNSDNAQYAEIAGAGLVMLALTALTPLFLIRYFLYLRITPDQHRAIHLPAHLDGPTEVRVDRDDTATATEPVQVPGPAYDGHSIDQVPSYNRSVWTGISLPLRALLVAEAALLFSWWVIMLVQECMSDVFTYAEADSAYFFNARQWFLAAIVGAVSLASAAYAERHLSRPSDVAAWAVSALMLAAFFVLVWPFAYQSVYDGGDLYQSVCQTGSSLCRLTQATGVLALIQGFLLLFTLVHTSLRVCTTWAVAPRVTAPGVLGRLSLSMLLVAWLVATVWLWAFATIAATVHSPGFGQQMPHVDAGGEGNLFVEGYAASQAFLLLAITTLAVWLAASGPGRTAQWQSPAWRGLTVAVWLMLAVCAVPMMIEVLRFAKTLDLNGVEGVLVAVFVMMAVAAVAGLVVEAALAMEPWAGLVDPALQAQQTAVVAKPPLPLRPGKAMGMEPVVVGHTTQTVQTVTVA